VGEVAVLGLEADQEEAPAVAPEVDREEAQEEAQEEVAAVAVIPLHRQITTRAPFTSIPKEYWD
jgi:hypothetical protein